MAMVGSRCNFSPRIGCISIADVISLGDFSTYFPLPSLSKLPSTLIKHSETRTRYRNVVGWNVSRMERLRATILRMNKSWNRECIIIIALTRLYGTVGGVN